MCDGIGETSYCALGKERYLIFDGIKRGTMSPGYDPGSI
jgi:hypothetical protein